MPEVLNLLKTYRVCPMPYFVPDVSKKVMRRASQDTENKGYFGAGRGGRTPTTLRSADFEFPENAVCL